MAWPTVARGQSADKVWRVGYLSPSSATNFSVAVFDAFRLKLNDLGYVEGRNLGLYTRRANDDYARLPTLAGELVSLAPNVVVSAANVATLALQRATSSIPIVMAAGADPLGSGFVKSLGKTRRQHHGVVQSKAGAPSHQQFCASLPRVCASVRGRQTETVSQSSRLYIARRQAGTFDGSPPPPGSKTQSAKTFPRRQSSCPRHLRQRIPHHDAGGVPAERAERGMNAAALLQSSGFLCFRRCRYGLEIRSEQRFLFIALVLILLSNPDHLPQNLYIKAVALGLLIDFLFRLGQFLELFLDLLDAFNNRAQLITCNLNRSAHGLPHVDETAQIHSSPSRGQAIAANRVSISLTDGFGTPGNVARALSSTLPPHFRHTATI